MSRALELLLSATVGGSLMALALWGLARLLRGRVSHAALRLLWLAVLLRFALPLPGAAGLAPALPQSVTVSAAVQTGVQTAASGSVGTAQVARAGAGMDARNVFIWVWVAGAAAVMVLRTGGYLRYRRRLLSAAAEPPERDYALLRELGGGRIRLVVSAETDAPVLLGLLRPTVVLPDRRMTEERLRLALRHELCHARAGDIALKWLASAVLAVHWFNPVTLLIFRELDAECELACDERLLRHMDESGRLSYGRALLCMAGAPSAPCAAGMGGSGKRMKQRISAIAAYRAPTRLTAALGVLIAAVVLCAGLIIGARAVGRENEPAVPPAQPLPAENVLPATDPGDAPTAAPSPAGAGGLYWPCPDCMELTVTFGSRTHPVFDAVRMHNGVDIPAEEGSMVVAAMEGTVSASEYSDSYGSYIILDHGGGLTTLYAHLSSASVSVGDTVSGGQEIARSGSTGWVTGPHLHFAVEKNGDFVDPMEYFE